MIRLTSVFVYSALTAITIWLFLHVQKTYGEGTPTFSKETLLLSMEYFKGYYFLLAPFLLSLLFFKRFSSFLFFLLATGTLYYSLKLQMVHFNKISILIIFMFLVISYYHIYFLKKENQEPYYFSNSGLSNLVRTDLIYPLECQLELLKGKQKRSGNILSWSKSGVFIHCTEQMTGSEEIVAISVEKFGRFFHFNGTIISTTKDSLGVGIKLDLETQEDIFGWTDLHQILQDRGLGPNYVT